VQSSVPWIKNIWIFSKFFISNDVFRIKSCAKIGTVSSRAALVEHAIEAKRKDQKDETCLFCGGRINKWHREYILRLWRVPLFTNINKNWTSVLGSSAFIDWPPRGLRTCLCECDTTCCCVVDTVHDNEHTCERFIRQNYWLMIRWSLSWVVALMQTMTATCHAYFKRNCKFIILVDVGSLSNVSQRTHACIRVASYALAIVHLPSIRPYDWLCLQSYRIWTQYAGYMELRIKLCFDYPL
jgi:hypothetical protein